MLHTGRCLSRTGGMSSPKTSNRSWRCFPHSPGKSQNATPKLTSARCSASLRLGRTTGNSTPVGWCSQDGEGRQGVQRRTSSWEEQILGVLENLDPLDRLKAIREVMWRKEILLEPITPAMESAAEGTLAALDCERAHDQRGRSAR